MLYVTSSKLRHSLGFFAQGASTGIWTTSGVGRLLAQPAVMTARATARKNWPAGPGIGAVCQPGRVKRLIDMGEL
jgi:hypothetical protein